MRCFMIKKGITLFLFLFLLGCVKSNEIKEVTGILRLGHEVRSFTDEANGKEYWIIDKSGKLIKSYQAVIGTEIMKYQPVKVILKVQDIGKQTDGFGAEYEGTYEVKEIISLSQA